MFIAADLQKIIGTKRIYMFMIYLRTKFHIPNCNGSSVTAMKLEANEN
jgi:hypothetical protein